MISAPAIVSLDIETTGLDPSRCALVAVGLADTHASEVRTGGDERDLLSWVETSLVERPPGTLLTTWNGEEFDLPFLHERFRRLGVRTSLALRPVGQVGKYGKPLYSATWASLRHIDIAPLYEGVAARLGVAWRLKPVARAVLGIEPIEIDSRGEAIENLDDDELRRYLRSDIDITLALSEQLATDNPLSLREATLAP